MNIPRWVERNRRCVGGRLFFAGFLLLALPSWGQKEPAVQRLYDHLIGTWTGLSRSYMTPSVAETPVVVHVAQSVNSDWLDLEYLYTMPGARKPDRRLEHDAFYLSAGILVREFVRDRSRTAGLRLQLENFSGLVRGGYGDYTARSAVLWGGRHTSERMEYHLRPDSWSYEVYVNTEGSTWAKTGDFELKRASTAR